MVDDVGLSGEARDERTVTCVADSILHPRIAKIRARDAIRQQQARAAFIGAILRQQRAGQLLAQETGAAGDHDVHCVPPGAPNTL